MLDREQQGAAVPGVSGYQVGDLVIDLGQQRVRRGETDIPLPSLSFDLLVTLARAAPNLLTYDQLTQRVWPGLVVTPETISQRVKLVRDALGDDPHAPRYIAGIRGRGYRMVAAVNPLVDRTPSQPPVGADANSYSASAQPSASSASGGVLLGRRFARITFAALAILAAGLAYVVLDRFWMSKHSGLAQPAAAPRGASAEVVVFEPPAHSIAVLPFVNMSGDHEQEYFAEGLTEELLNSLSRINELQVAARTSSFSFIGEHPDIITVAHKLNVGTVLEGSVRRGDNTVRVTAQLIDGATGFQLWSQSYDRNLHNALQLQTDIATAVAGALKVTLLDDAVARIATGGTNNPAAFDAYLRASKSYWDCAAGGCADNDEAIAFYTEAIRLDPDYALAYAARSIAPGPLDARRSDALKAIALAPNLGEGHLALALVDIGSLEFRAADEECHRALELAPSNARVLRDCGQNALEIGRGDVGLQLIRRAVVLDPLNLESQSHLADALWTLRRYTESLAAARNAELLHPGSHTTFIGFVYYGLGDLENARSTCEQAADDPGRSFCLAITYDKLGRHADAEAMLARLRAERGNSSPIEYSAIYAQWGNNVQALDLLERAARSRDQDLHVLKSLPLLDPLRHEPRFEAIERTLNFPD